MSKKIFSLLLAGLMTFGVLAFAEGEEEEKLIAASPVTIQLTIGEKAIAIDDIVLELDVAPCIINDRTMVPMRAVFELFGATVHWDGETRTVYGLREDVVVVMQIGQAAMFVNNNRIELDSPSVIVDDRTMVPLRAVAEAYGSEVGYDAETKTVTIVK